jgi:hypothetical protein
VMAISAHQKVSPSDTTTPPRTTLNTFTLPPNQKQHWCHGFPCSAPGGNMVDVATLDVLAQLLVSRRGCGHSWVTLPAGYRGLMRDQGPTGRARSG